jgi:hypothetical protein
MRAERAVSRGLAMPVATGDVLPGLLDLRPRASMLRTRPGSWLSMVETRHEICTTCRPCPGEEKGARVGGLAGIP